MDKIIIEEFLKVSMLGRTYKNDFEYDELCDSEKINLLLNISLFGKEYRRDLSDDAKISLAIDRAYLDFCRTIRKDNNPSIEVLKETRNAATTKIKEAIENILSKKSFPQWHEGLCNKLISQGYTFGQAQKWVNMTMKYLIVLDYRPVVSIQNDLHAPIDIDVINRIFNDKDQNDPIQWKENDLVPWSSSKLDKTKEYDKYSDLQEWIRKHCKEGESPIEWEFKAWNDPAVKGK